LRVADLGFGAEGLGFGEEAFGVWGVRTVFRVQASEFSLESG
jgi:hypothetical protein